MKTYVLPLSMLALAAVLVIAGVLIRLEKRTKSEASSGSFRGWSKSTVSVQYPDGSYGPPLGGGSAAITVGSGVDVSLDSTYTQLQFSSWRTESLTTQVQETSKQILDGCQPKCDWGDYAHATALQLAEMTAAGFLAPAPVKDVNFAGGYGVEISGDVDWSKPIGFAVIDCDHKSHMVDGKTSALIRWDTKRKCLMVTEEIK